MVFRRVCKNLVKFISGWPGLFAGLEMLYLVCPAVLEADPGPSGQVNDRIPEFQSSGGFSSGKEKVKKIFYFKEKFSKIFYQILFCMIWAIIISMKIKCCYHNYHICMYIKVYYYQYVFLSLQTELRFKDQLI